MKGYSVKRRNKVELRAKNKVVTWILVGESLQDICSNQNFNETQSIHNLIW